MDVDMRILVVSDSHGYNTHLFKVIDSLKPIDMLIHCGDSGDLGDYINELVDCPVVMVRGNCDDYCQYRSEEILEVNGNKILVTHGHMYGVKSGLGNLYERAKELSANIVLYGHSHIPDLTQMYGIMAMNPGSISLPKQESRIPTYGIIDISDNGKAYCSLHNVK